MRFPLRFGYKNSDPLGGVGPDGEYRQPTAAQIRAASDAALDVALNNIYTDAETQMLILDEIRRRARGRLPAWMALWLASIAFALSLYLLTHHI